MTSGYPGGVFLHPLFQSTLPLRGVTLADSHIIFESDISIHTPLAGSDPTVTTTPMDFYIFQSTLPLRGVTLATLGFVVHNVISIHTPLAGSDDQWMDRYWEYDVFQSTLPLRGVTYHR